uniref:Ubiquitin-like protease family profile domain-containing protein n=1 Tax=Arundo donax TaxID=35708 RepID=A0A0A9B7M7_ARUDO
MSNGGWLNFRVMNAFCKMFSHQQLMIDNFNKRAEGQPSCQYFDNATSVILMNPLSDFKHYKKEFLENVGFQLEKTDLVYIPCCFQKQWVLVIVNFRDKIFDVLNSDYNADSV